jgi:hypothetical protein
VQIQVSTARRMRTLLLSVSLCACWAPPAEVDAPSDSPRSTTIAPSDAPAETPQIVCDMSKFSFTKEAGCVNDGWVEFCAAKAGAPVLSALRGIAPDVSIAENEIGHAGCDESNDYLVSQPVRASDCMSPLGALTDAAWNTLCALSQVPETKHFVPGFSQ